MEYRRERERRKEGRTKKCVERGKKEETGEKGIGTKQEREEGKKKKKDGNF